MHKFQIHFYVLPGWVRDRVQAVVYEPLTRILPRANRNESPSPSPSPSPWHSVPVPEKQRKTKENRIQNERQERKNLSNHCEMFLPLRSPVPLLPFALYCNQSGPHIWFIFLPSGPWRHITFLCLCCRSEKPTLIRATFLTPPPFLVAPLARLTVP